MNYEEQIKDILDNFDFERVHDVMRYLNWEWHHGDGVYCVPSIEKLEIKAHNLLNYVVEEGLYIADGGFEAENLAGTLFLKFVLEEGYGGDE